MSFNIAEDEYRVQQYNTYANVANEVNVGGCVVD